MSRLDSEMRVHQPVKGIQLIELTKCKTDAKRLQLIDRWQNAKGMQLIIAGKM